MANDKNTIMETIQSTDNFLLQKPFILFLLTGILSFYEFVLYMKRTLKSKYLTYKQMKAIDTVIVIIK